MLNVRRSMLSVCLGLLVLGSAVSLGETSPGYGGLACQAALKSAYAPPIDAWIEDLRTSYRADEATLSAPPSFPEHTWWGRAKNDLCLLRLKRKLAAAPGSSPLSRLTRTTLFEGVLEFANDVEADATMNSVARGFEKMRRFQAEFREDVTRYRGLFGEEFFGRSVFDKGTVNTTLAKIFAMLGGRPGPRSRDAVNAIALLHPITDDALDEGHLSKATVEKLSRFLEDGAWPRLETPYENVVFGLLGYIHRDFPPAGHPTLHALLNRLHRAQLRSLSQKGEMSEDDLLRVSFDKGGLSVAITAYLALGGLEPAQYEFFFKAGAIFQIWDDLNDIGADLAEGSRTVWTNAIRERRPLGGVIRRFLALQADFERRIPSMTANFDPRQLYARVYLSGFKLTTMRAFETNRKYFSRRERNFVRRLFPVSFLTIRKGFDFATRDRAVPEEWREIARALDAY